jgi:hypothetical protein
MALMQYGLANSFSLSLRVQLIQFSLAMFLYFRCASVSHNGPCGTARILTLTIYSFCHSRELYIDVLCEGFLVDPIHEEIFGFGFF